MKSDNKFLAVLFIAMGILGALAMFVGFYLMLRSIGGSVATMMIWLGVFLGGLLLLSVPIIVVLINKRKINK